MEAPLSARIVPSVTAPNSNDQRSVAAAVDVALRAFFNGRTHTVGDIGGSFADTVQSLEQFVLRGGKRIRPMFAWLGWIGSGGDPAGTDSVAVLKACAALELVQACALIHDDIIDSSRTRRGFPTVHVEFADRHRSSRWIGNPDDFGADVAILLGDLALAWSDDMMRESGVSADAAQRLAPVWASMRTEVLAGQLLDVAGEATGDNTVEAAVRINRYKTAAYTVERPLHLGAVLADADESLVADFRSYGTDLGIAFQLRDDLLGVFGDPVVTGKPSGDDLREGKRTVLFAVGLKRAEETSPATADLLRRRIGTDLTDQDVEQLRAILTDLGAVADVEERITALTTRALTIIDGSAATPEAKQLLHDMAVSATSRTA